MWDLDNSRLFHRVIDLEVPWAHTWANTSVGKTDHDRRERLRSLAAEHVRLPSDEVAWWAARITVRKHGHRPFDIENVAKPILDAFSERQIRKDKSAYHDLALYPDDAIDYVRFLVITGERTTGPDSTRIELFARLG
jgi:hypothetical protein